MPEPYYTDEQVTSDVECYEWDTGCPTCGNNGCPECRDGHSDYPPDNGALQ